jgi:predicted MFS family arabinose efflux permease
VVAVTFGLAAGSARPTRAFAFLNISYAVFASIFYLTVPLAITHAGASGAFLAMAAAAVIGALLMPMFPSQRTGAAAALELPRLSSLPGWGFVAFAALIVLWSGHNAMWTFIDRVGHASGLNIQQIGAVLSLSAIVTIAGPTAVGILDTRFGYRAPMLVAIAIKTTAVLTLATMMTPLVFSTLVPLFLFLSLFITPYIMGLLSEADPAGRLAAAASAAMTAGASSGAFIGGLALTHGGLPGLGWAAAGQFVIFTVLILIAAAARRRVA